LFGARVVYDSPARFPEFAMRSNLKILVAAIAFVAVAACDEKPLNTPAPSEPQDSKPAPKDQKPASQPSDPALAAIDKFIADKKIDTTSSGWRTKLPKPDKVTTWDAKKTYYWSLETNKGTMKFKFYTEAPMHVTSFAYLTKLGYFDGLSFHRVINGFMAQGGCPLGTGTGSPGYRYDHENSKYRHDKRGQLSTANAGPGTDGSQFFITFLATPHLDGRHALFGEIVDGSDVLGKLEAAGSPSGKTKEPLTITKATVSVE
jgi:peptidyl-prolyl cis-trans isomerase B (cyclophilin B)